MALSRNDNVRPLVVILFDAQNWSLHRIAQQLSHHLSLQFDIRCGQYSDFAAGSPTDMVPVSDLRRIQTLVCLWHGDATHAFARVPPRTRKVVCVYDCGAYWGSALQEAVVAADAIGYVSLPVKDKLLQRWPDVASKLAPCTDGVDSTRQFTPIPWPRPSRRHRLRRHLTIGWCGSTGVHGDRLKGVDLIREAVSRAPWLNWMVADRSLRFDQMRDLFYKKIDVYVCMSVEEGTPNPLLESSACGRPFVSSNVGVAATLLADARRLQQSEAPGIVLQRRDPLLLIEALRAYHVDRRRMRAAGRSARHVIERADWDWSARAQQFAAALFDANPASDSAHETAS